MLRLHGIVAGYGPIEVLHTVTLEVPEGGVVVLLGANGAGKTTLLRVISGLVRPRQGTVEFGRQRIDGLAPERIARLGIAHVPQGRGLFPELTVEENLRLGAYGRPGSDLDRVLALFPRLAERRRQEAATLSGGEQQMLAIARGLMGRPRLLMLDEPSLGLAPRLVEQVGRLVQELHAQGTTVLMAEQNAVLALSVADYAYVLQNGVICLEGSPEELRDSPQLRRLYLGAV